MLSLNISGSIVTTGYYTCLSLLIYNQFRGTSRMRRFGRMR
ncbi:MAG TPA: hypothetical protein PLH91_04105 [Tenuifilaceae bacterium]|nr:hypothetical protein [Tenuifilaceae bacterium]